MSVELFLFVLLISANLSYAKTVKYELVIENTPINMSGKKTVDFALTVNGSRNGDQVR